MPIISIPITLTATRHTTKARCTWSNWVTLLGAGARPHLLAYYRKWRFKHPNASDFIRIAEKESGLQLNWYNMYWVNTTNAIDYSIDSLWEAEGGTKIRLARLGQMPMPIDVKLTFKDGSTEWHYVPLNLMFGEKRPKKGKRHAKFTGLAVDASPLRNTNRQAPDGDYTGGDRSIAAHGGYGTEKQQA
jgi:hypothetical protein